MIDFKNKKILITGATEVDNFIDKFNLLDRSI